MSIYVQIFCNGKLLRSIYLFPNCNALYCRNCSNALSELENACWVCNETNDVSKPVKLASEIEEEIEVDITETKGEKK